MKSGDQSWSTQHLLLALCKDAQSASNQVILIDSFENRTLIADQDCRVIAACLTFEVDSEILAASGSRISFIDFTSEGLPLILKWRKHFLGFSKLANAVTCSMIRGSREPCDPPLMVQVGIKSRQEWLIGMFQFKTDPVNVCCKNGIVLSEEVSFFKYFKLVNWKIRSPGSHLRSASEAPF